MPLLRLGFQALKLPLFQNQCEISANDPFIFNDEANAVRHKNALSLSSDLERQISGQRRK
jgi:hypothetical protein